MAVLRPIAIAAAALLMMGVCAYGQHTLCAGAEGKSQACCPPCSSCGANDGPGNNGQFDTGFGNQGFGNDGFNNVGDFNIGSANKGDCNLASGGSGIPAGGCPEPIFDLLRRACTTHPTYIKCAHPPAAYGTAAIAVIRAATASCAK